MLRSLRSSVQLRLFLIVSALMFAAMIGAALLSIGATNNEIEEDFDALLIRSGELLWSFVSDEIDEAAPFTIMRNPGAAFSLDEDARNALNDDARLWGFRVWYKGILTLRSENVPGTEIGVSESGFTTLTAPDGTWRVFSQHPAGTDVVVETMQNVADREALETGIAFAILGPVFVLLLATCALLFLGINMGLSGIKQTTKILRERQIDDFSEISLDPMPTELRPVIDALNGLFGRLRQLLARERQLIDDAAHELRTPLAGLRVQAQVAQRAVDPQQRDDAMADLLTSIDRASHLMTQILTLARVSNQPAPVSRADLVEVARGRLAEFGVLALNKQVALTLQNVEPIYFPTNPDLLAVLIGVLVDNSLKFTPAGGAIVVVVSAAPAPVIDIIDTGPGIAAMDRERVFDRFYRSPTADSPGSGLGLTIAREIANRLGIVISLATAPGSSGLKVSLKFEQPSAT